MQTAFPGNSGMRLWQNFDVYNVLAQASQMPYTQRPEPFVGENQNVSGKEKEKNKKWLLFFIFLAIAFFLHGIYKVTRRRGR